MNSQNKKGFPPGRIKIMNALSELMREKDFHSITTAEIASTAGVTEGLIYKYFKDKKDLLYQVLDGHFHEFHDHIVKMIAPCSSAIEKLSIIIRTTLKSYAANRVFAKILLLEVRNSPNYFESDAYNMVRIYSGTILEIINQGMASGELKPDINPFALRQVILGSIEHACLGEVIFGKTLNTETVSDHICNIIFQGVQP
ncbi:HTH-type transcriptional regulator (TetR-family protein) [Desulfamplus magnetovallimortis]|uniref:HTH-type transcriptional regulator (TetR-family protein) n=1 Tax=Desulfamplus magnetovallimortis TaxID=1246637 RepID=A0A1W1H7Z1_9BACT|nr:TetR/AcrR family transcriptional regulator [Desulfamplus magnetovallimortis]SLM28589.1 HTH-type transcriptional regulator (TetR-family protein) [Desulfamplus magnetovallimortis]